MNNPFPSELAAKIQEAGIIAVLIVERVEDAVPLAKSLLEGGVRIMELTLRTPTALDSLRAICDQVPDMVAGVGTILTSAQADAAKQAGAAFGVSPGFNRRVVDAAVSAGLPFAPGVATPSDVEAALEAGCQLMKFFPCEPSGGLPYLKAMAAPYLHLGVKFIPLGGVNAANMKTYLSEPIVSAVGGSWLAPKDLVSSANWQGLSRLAAEAVRIISETR
ncbi:MAG: bifunctional 4-hydroxy-2-oxoglutarate aldolase/2-dehydro-3-deoxy-phosphogluconate aldolase [Terrimicrobiaceae bacterium]